MKDLKLDSEGDLLFDGKNFYTTETTDESLAQRIKIKLRLFQGEWLLDTSIGMPWFQEVLGKKVSKAQVDSLIRNRVNDTDGVDEILEFESSVDGTSRVYSITKLTIRDQDGGIAEVNI